MSYTLICLIYTRFATTNKAILKKTSLNSCLFTLSSDSTTTITAHKHNNPEIRQSHNVPGSQNQTLTYTNCLDSN